MNIISSQLYHTLILIRFFIILSKQWGRRLIYVAGHFLPLWCPEDFNMPRSSNISETVAFFAIRRASLINNHLWTFFIYIKGNSRKNKPIQHKLQYTSFVIKTTIGTIYNMYSNFLVMSLLKSIVKDIIYHGVPNKLFLSVLCCEGKISL